MKETLTLDVKPRAGLGKGANRRLRAADVVPGVYYDATGANFPVMAEAMPLTKLYQKTGSAHVFNLRLTTESGQETKPALIKALQFHPFKAKITHVDFYGVDLNKEIRVFIPVEVTGKPQGVIKGGALEVFREEIEVVCLPMAVPDKVVVDVTPLDVNQNVHIQELTLPEGVKAVYEDNFAVLGVVLPTAEATPAEGGAAETPA